MKLYSFKKIIGYGSLLLVVLIGIFLVWQFTKPVPTTSNLIDEKIMLTNLKSGDEIKSPLTITGEAKGTWYFEASFPVMLTDWDGKIIAQGVAQAQQNWMTSDFVLFIINLKFDTKDISGNYSNRGTLIFKKDNPSGMPEYDDAVEIPVIIK